MSEVVCPRDRMATLLVSAPVVSLDALLPGARIGGRYEIEREIGRGGYGRVYAARHLGTGQGVALKILNGAKADEGELGVRRLFIEAQVTSGLKHPNTVRVFDFGQDDQGYVYLAMELLQGRTLKQELQLRAAEGRGFGEREILHIAVAVTRSLSEAHARGLVHRDLKPDNIFLLDVPGDERAVKVLDFGIAKLGEGQPTLSTPTSVPGTPAYMSPEQAFGLPLDGRSDLYGLGVILFQLASGRLPFLGASDLQTLYLHAHEPLPSLGRAAEGRVSAGYARVVERAMAKDPAGRYEDAKALREALEALLAGVSPMATAPVEPLEVVGRGRGPWVLAAIAVALGLAGALLALGLSTRPVELQGTEVPVEVAEPRAATLPAEAEASRSSADRSGAEPPRPLVPPAPPPEPLADPPPTPALPGGIESHRPPRGSAGQRASGLLAPLPAAPAALLKTPKALPARAAAIRRVSPRHPAASTPAPGVARRAPSVLDRRIEELVPGPGEPRGP